MILRNEDRGVIKNWQNLGILTAINVDAFRRATQAGNIVVICGDCERSGDMYDHMRSIMGHRRIHLKAYNGGPLRLNENVPIPEKFRAHDQFLAGLEESRIKKGIPCLTLVGHYPCLVASDIGYDINQTLLKVLETKIMICQKFSWDPDQIFTFFHIDDNKVMRTFNANAIKEVAVV